MKAKHELPKLVWTSCCGKSRRFKNGHVKACSRTEAAEQRGELRRRLSDAEVARDQAMTARPIFGKLHHFFLQLVSPFAGDG